MAGWQEERDSERKELAADLGYVSEYAANLSRFVKGGREPTGYSKEKIKEALAAIREAYTHAATTVPLRRNQ